MAVKSLCCHACAAVYLFIFFTCAVYVVGPSDHLLYDLSSDAPHVLPDLDPSGLDHEHILVHCGQKKMGEKDALISRCALPAFIA